MGSTRTAWHVLFEAQLAQRGPRRLEVRREVPLSTELLRADYLLLQRGQIWANADVRPTVTLIRAARCAQASRPYAPFAAERRKKSSMP
ncbi:hypothetical protein [Sorangium cellulosum]|uniref:hypothetical protein n=1 Tax=Sorangium cellulosum TaxID=56 RepID=UPI0002DE29FC|nr:hypothetical protein [Sorangium cellulosum]